MVSYMISKYCILVTAYVTNLHNMENRIFSVKGHYQSPETDTTIKISFVDMNITDKIENEHSKYNFVFGCY